jgi:hypothetical protein
MFRKFLYGGLAAAILVTGSAATAATLTAVEFDRSELGNARQAMRNYLDANPMGNLRVETFEGLQAWNGTSGTSNPQNTNVGAFTGIGHGFKGHSSVDGGTKTQIRSDTTFPWARYDADLSAPGPNWLDSNDVRTLKWDVKGSGAFDTIGFFLLDATDRGGRFSIKVGDQRFSDLAGGKRLANGNVYFVRITLDAAVEDITIRMGHNHVKDGFGLDNIVLGNSAGPAPVPVPPAMALLFTGIAALAGLRRRRRAAA